MSPPDLFSELKRRRVFRAATAYGVVGWALVEVADTVFPHMGLPDRAVTVVIALLLLGFPVAVLLAWGFELTRKGLRRTAPQPGDRGDGSGSGPPRVLYVVLIVPVLVATFIAGASLLRTDPASEDGDPRAEERGGAGLAVAEPSGSSLAVLPFVNLGGEETDDFTSGVAEDIRTQLGRLPELRVIGRTSVLRYRGSDRSAREIGGELGVSHVLEGSVQRAGDRLRITVGLVRVGPDEQVWGEGYDREAGDVFAIQTDVAERVASAILHELSRADIERIGARAPSTLGAYEVHLAARALLARRDVAGLVRAAELFEEANRLDPGYAPAYVGLADAYTLMNTWGGLSAREAAGPAREAAERALGLDPLLGEAWTSLAYIDAWFERDWAAAEIRFLRAIELNPNYSTAYHWYAVVLAQSGRLEEARVAIERARALDPGSLIILTISGLQRHFARDPEAALEWHRRALELEPDYSVGHMWMGQAVAAQGNFEEALTHYRRAAELDPGSPVMRSALAYGLARTGDPAGARAILADIRAGGAESAVPPHWLAQAYVGLGDIEAAFEILEQGVEDGSPMANILMEPLLDPIRGDPRYEHILAALGLSGRR